MTGWSRRVFVIAATVTLLASTAVPASADPDAPLPERLDAAVAARLAELGVPGAIVGLSIPGELDYVKAFGVADTATGRPMSVDDHTRIGSVTKTFTGTAVLQLVDQGRVGLQDPISRYVDGVPNGDEITLDQLGRMRSGLPSYTEDEGFFDRLYTESPDGPDAFASTSQQLLDIAFALPVKFPPNAQFDYCNTNTVLLGMVVERVTGQPLADYLRQHVFDPLGLAQTSYPPNGTMPEPFAHGYTRTPSDVIVDAASWNPSWANAAGQMVSNRVDMTTWARALGRGALLTPWTQAQRVAGQEEDGLTYGFAVFNAHGWLGHNGSLPGYTTVVVYLPERDATLVVFVNSDAAPRHSADELATTVTRIVTPDHVYRLGATPGTPAEN